MRRNFEVTPKGYRGVVYKYTSRITGKTYVGETVNEKERQKSWKKPKSNAYAGTKIAKAREELGIIEWDYLSEEIFAATPEELEKQLKLKQKEWIDKEDSVANGYNSSYGDGMEGIKHTDESKAKISKNHRKIQTDDTRDKISTSLKGRVVSDSTKDKISAGNKGKKRTPAQNKAQSDARKGKNPTAATEGAKKWVEKNGGGYWKNHQLSPEAKANMKAAQQKLGTSVIAIDSEGKKQEYPTMLDAAKACELNVGSVASAIKTGGTTRNGFKFKKNEKNECIC